MLLSAPERLVGAAAEEVEERTDPLLPCAEDLLADRLREIGDRFLKAQEDIAKRVHVDLHVGASVASYADSPPLRHGFGRE